MTAGVSRSTVAERKGGGGGEGAEWRGRGRGVEWWVGERIGGLALG